jgi:hypothetical protein
LEFNVKYKIHGEYLQQRKLVHGGTPREKYFLQTVLKRHPPWRASWQRPDIFEYQE